MDSSNNDDLMNLSMSAFDDVLDESENNDNEDLLSLSMSAFDDVLDEYENNDSEDLLSLSMSAFDDVLDKSENNDSLSLIADALDEDYGDSNLNPTSFSDIFEDNSESSDYLAFDNNDSLEFDLDDDNWDFLDEQSSFIPSEDIAKYESEVLEELIKSSLRYIQWTTDCQNTFWQSVVNEIDSESMNELNKQKDASVIAKYQQCLDWFIDNCGDTPTEISFAKYVLSVEKELSFVNYLSNVLEFSKSKSDKKLVQANKFSILFILEDILLSYIDNKNNPINSIKQLEEIITSQTVIGLLKDKTIEMGLDSNGDNYLIMINNVIIESIYNAYLNKESSVKDIPFDSAQKAINSYIIGIQALINTPSGTSKVGKSLIDRLKYITTVWNLKWSKNVKTEADLMISNHKSRLINKFNFINSFTDKTSEDCLNKFTLVSKYTLSSDSELLCKCTCGCNTTQEGKPIRLKDLIIFNFINKKKGEFYNPSGSNSEISELLGDFRNPENIFLLGEKPYNVHRIKYADTDYMLDTIKDAIEKKTDSTVISGVNKYYGCACSFNFIDAVCNCGKHILLMPRLMRYLCAWHSYHTDAVVRIFDTSIMVPGELEYRDDVLHDTIMKYSNLSYNYDEEVTKEKFIQLFDDLENTDDFEVDENEPAVYKARYKSRLQSNSESLDNDEEQSSNDSELNKLDNSKFGLGVLLTDEEKNSYTRIMKLFDKRSVSYRGYQNKLAPVKSIKGSYKPIFILNNTGNLKDNIKCWRSFNTTTDKLYSALVYLAKRLNLPYDINPKSILSRLIRTKRFKRLRLVIQARVHYLNINRYYSILKNYMNDNFNISAFRKFYISDLWPIDVSDLQDILNLLNKEFILYNTAVNEIYSGSNLDDDATDILPYEDDVYTDVNINNINQDILNNTISAVNNHYNKYTSGTYSYWRNPANFELSHIDTSNFDSFVTKEDEYFINFITDELCWKVWYEDVLVVLISENKPALIESITSTSASKENKLTKIVMKLSRDICKAALELDLNSVEYLWEKLPRSLENISIEVLNKNLYEVTAIMSPAPFPITRTMISILLQSDNEEDSVKKFTAYLKHKWKEDLNEYLDIDTPNNSLLDSSTDNMKPEELWKIVVKWIKDFNNCYYDLTLPEYLKTIKSTSED